MQVIVSISDGVPITEYITGEKILDYAPEDVSLRIIANNVAQEAWDPKFQMPKHPLDYEMTSTSRILHNSEALWLKMTPLFHT